MAKNRIAITDHAIVRFLERAMGMDRDEIGRQILPDVQESLARQMGNGTYAIDDSHCVVVQDGVVTTVLPRHRTTKPMKPEKPRTMRTIGGGGDGGRDDSGEPGE